VHLADFPKPLVTLSAAEREAWDRILQLREEVNKVLEVARDPKSKQIGKSLEADIVVSGDLTRESLLGGIDADLARIFIVSHVDFRRGEPGVTSTKARGKKCGRCWNRREEVLHDGDPCARCQAILDTLAPPDEPTV